ncbi:serine/threonine protein kinase [Corallococcus sp. H22C18031201]|nr:serine/threonine protein kinase [Corallococcus sp. H22C18031201]
MNPQSFGKYQLLKKLATGGMAEVWLARQMGIEGFQKNLVVKRILPHLAEDREFVEMFRNEALIAARFNHPNIAQVYEFGEANGTYYIAMEFIHGEDLGRVMRKAYSANQWIARPLAIRIVASACEGLYYAHTRTDDAGRPLKVVHRDISPQNILISFDGSVKLVDFGIAKAADQASLTKSGAIKGKFAYMAPEQAAGRPLDARADIFAIGLVLYELLTGHRPLKRDSELATLQAAMECAIQVPSAVADVPEDMDAVVMRALAKNADDRYREARQFQTALEELLVSQRWVAGSVQISELMETLFADRLEEERKQGQFVPVDEEASGSGSSPPAQPDRGRNRPATMDMSWEAPPGESAPRDRSRASSPSRTSVPRRSSVAPAVQPEEPNEWEAPSGTGVEVPPRRRTSVAEPAARRGTSTSNPNATQVARTSSRSDLSRAGGAEPSSPPRRTQSRVAPMAEEPPPRSRSGVHPMDEEADDERTMLPPPEPPPRRRTGMVQAAAESEPPRRRTSSRVDQVAAAPRPRPAPRDEDSEESERRPERVIAADDRKMRRGIEFRNVAMIGFIVGLLGVLGVFHKPILKVLNSTASDGQGVWLTVNTNEKVKVSVKHTERCSAAEPVTVLGFAPFTRKDGAHLQDTLILENEDRGIYVEDPDVLAFGEPGDVKVLDRTFKEGNLRLKITPKGLAGLTIMRDNQRVGLPGSQLSLMEGKQKLELRGPKFKDPVFFEAIIKPGETTEVTLDVTSALGQ